MRQAPGRIIYLLYCYDECGPSDLCVTDDRGALSGLLERNWPVPSVGGERDRLYVEKWLAEARVALTKALAQSDEELLANGRHSLHAGWGGGVLHVVRLAA